MASVQTLARSAFTSCYCPVVKQKCSKEFSINSCEVIFRNYFSLIYYPPFPPLTLISSSSSSSFNGPWDQIPPWNNLRKGVLLILSRVLEGLVCGFLSLCLWINCESEQHAGRSCCSKQKKNCRENRGAGGQLGFYICPLFFHLNLLVMMVLVAFGISLLPVSWSFLEIAFIDAARGVPFGSYRWLQIQWSLNINLTNKNNF